MSAALITAAFVGIAALGYATVLGFTALGPADVFRHTSLGIFATLVTLLAHSMTMFYLIGKGRAVREAVQEARLSGELYRAVARVRRPVFSIATMAMALTMATAILGGGVDTNTVPVMVHLVFALAAVAANLVALRTEIVAMLSSARIVAEVDRLIEDREEDRE